MIYLKILRIILLIFMVAAAWLTIQEYLSWVFGWIVVVGDAIFLVMTDIKIKEYENDL